MNAKFASYFGLRVMSAGVIG